ncbi:MULTISPECIES: hypothetical protein [unclassified Carboxylicivirga]|uniref:hypothetical protein n=1 Tax=Carboxylicivirga TaxID=1628153 RepID=UPI003D32ED49
MTSNGKTCSEANNSTLQATPSASEMTAIKKYHAHNQAANYPLYLNKHKHELVSELLKEQDAKNQAHYFLMEKGLIEEFKQYCHQAGYAID